MRNKEMTRKELINALIEEMEKFGEAFIGTYDVQGEKVIKLYRAILKEVQTRNYNDIVCWDKENGMIWIA